MDQVIMRTKRLALENAIQVCRECKLAKYSVNMISKVFGNGNCTDPDFFMIGLAPSYKSNATKSNKPHRLKPSRAFQHNVGFRFRNLLKQAGIYELTYITNILKCSTPKNRQPKMLEKDTCLKWLKDEFNHFSPSVVITLGRDATEWIERRADEVGSDNIVFLGKRVMFFSVYHPNYCYSYHKLTIEKYIETFSSIKEQVGL